MRNKFSAVMLAACTIALSGCGDQSSIALTTSTAETVETAETDKAAIETDSEDAVDAETADPANTSGSANEGSAKDKSYGTGDKFECTDDESHAIHADGTTESYDNISVEKTGDADGDNSDFYGTNAAVYAENNADLTIKDSYIHTAGSHANAVFSYGDGTTVHISDSKIETEQNNSGGVMVTGGGTLIADDLDVDTKGGSSAAIRSDRGGGTLTVNGGEYRSYGSGSPAVYSTADITVNDAELYSDISQAVVVEGKNSVTLNNTDAVGNNTHKNSDKSERFQAVMVYQSMSGDAAEGKGVFRMNGGSLTSLNEGMFFVTNTVAEIELDNVELIPASDDLLRIEKAGWGNEGSNGGQVTFTANDQAMSGIVTVDDISSLNLILTGDSVFEGSIENAGEVYVELSENAVWKLTADTAISSLTCGKNSIDLNGHALTVNGTAYTEGTESEGKAIEVKVSENSGHKPEMKDGKPGDGDGSHGPENVGPGDGGHGNGKPGSDKEKPDRKPDNSNDKPEHKKPDSDKADANESAGESSKA